MKSLFFVYSGAMFTALRASLLSAVLCLFCVFVHSFNVEADRPEAVVTAYHGRLGVLHPVVVESGTTVGQCHYKGRHTLPCTVAYLNRFLPAVSNPRLLFLHVPSMFNGVLIFSFRSGWQALHTAVIIIFFIASLLTTPSIHCRFPCFHSLCHHTISSHLLV